MEIEFVGAAQTVTGSMHLVRAPHATVLLDCGLFQGRRRESFERNRHLPLPIEEIDVAVLSLGRRLVERRARVRIFGVERDRRAEVVVLNGFSAHADQADLVSFANACRERGPLRKVALVHGEPKAQHVLRELLRDKHGFASVMIPKPGDRLTV